ncbi:class I SAM-dependent methyltransferase [Chryseobacterium sp. SSA4.19]|uniref:class I SAM-dependent methyltransferase n=1 Tax=Chryseobacterium sp. SSA4.19 TaxID=2919915 RepID=UPI001F4D55AF|nr:class I SAM-dependent methyltransferase [Chryseobacterium sp. SSA4.19]MCJ8153121.1 class I SAM-dependent methyltransferase [Chryseobacterium sp. SSA4.19]
MIPKEILIKNEDHFRRFLKPLYQGKNNACTVCGTKLKNFVQLQNGQLICPVCGSLPRTRRLYNMLQEEFLKPNMSFLDFSPSRMLYRKWKSKKDISYFPTDFENEFLSDYHYDITNIQTEGETFDLIVCYHILEHIADDRKAMSELYRVLKKGGTALIQTPFKEGDIYEDNSVVSAGERLKHFGQEDHVRIYSVDGLENRLKEAGFHVDIRNLDGDAYYGFSKDEKVLICTKDN